MTRIRVGGKWVQFVTEDALILTEDPEEAGVYSWAGSIVAQDLVKYHILLLDDTPAN